MGRFLQHSNKEYVKMAMLKQEETFVDQVNELHRLYQVQKTLMGDLKKKKTRKQQETTTGVDLTLAIGSSRDSTRKREEEEQGRSDSGGTSQLSSTLTLKLYDWGRIQMPDMNVNCDRTEANRTSWQEDLDLCLVRS